MSSQRNDSGNDPWWVFGYGSLLWNPGFPHRRTEPALLTGAHRSLCVYSWVHRGTQARPGLVLGLDRGGACKGLAFEVDPADRTEVIDYLRAREQQTMVYKEAYRRIKLDSGKRVTALTFLVDQDHAQYAGRLEPARMLEVVDGAVGNSGENWEYVVNSTASINEMGLRDPVLEWLSERLRRP